MSNVEWSTCIPMQRTRDAITTSSLRQNDVATSFWRNNDVVIASCAYVHCRKWAVLNMEGPMYTVGWIYCSVCLSMYNHVQNIYSCIIYWNIYLSIYKQLLNPRKQIYGLHWRNKYFRIIGVFICSYPPCFDFELQTLQRKYHQFGDNFVTGCTRSCHFGKILCSQR